MRRGIVIGVPGVALATAGGLLAQLRHSANAPLPHFADLDPSGTYGRGPATAVRLTVLGDSSMTGPGLDRSEHIWTARLAERLAWTVELRSHAKGGSRARDVLERQLPAALENPPDLYVVAIGANDVIHATPTRSYARQLDSILVQLASAAPVVTLGIGDLSLIPRLPRTLRPAVAHRSAMIDRTHKLVVADLDRVHRVPVGRLSDPHFRARGAELFAADLFHPNRQGHELWAELFQPYVERALLGHREHVIDLRPTPSRTCHRPAADSSSSSARLTSTPPRY